MIKNSFKLTKLLVLIQFLLVLPSVVFGQSQLPKVAVIPTSEEKLHACVVNRVIVYARQEKPITIDDINARLIIEYIVKNDSTFIPVTRSIDIEEVGENEFLLKGIKEVGSVEFEIHLENEIVYTEVKVFPLNVNFVIGRTRLAEREISIEQLNGSLGIMGYVDFNGLSAKGLLSEFKIIGISKSKDATIQVLNKGPKFSKEAKAMFHLLEYGDQIVFYDIGYRVGCDNVGSLISEHDYVLRIK